MTALRPRFTLGDHMRRALNESPYTSLDMAHYFGVAPQTVSAWLNGKRTPGTATLRLWAERTGVDYAWLCAARDSNPEPADYWPAAA